MRKFFKVLGILFLILTVISVITYHSYHEELPQGKVGAAADSLATKMLHALDYKAYKNTRYIEWNFRGVHDYKWDKKTGIVEVTWDSKKVILHTKEIEKSIAYEDGKESDNSELISTAQNYFNNDSFWLVAPYKVFDFSVTRSIVPYKGKKALLVTYNAGGSTPGDSYLWILDGNYIPVAFKMWVSILPIGGVEASWNNWTTTSSGAKLPTKHSFSTGTLELENIKGYR
ncbi:hypothetical protein [Tenacibaculum sp. SG-28]|uniref:hypothetical protein n=1 Tax=Tenacibaculum sp. SG-28 TaxID=754426 RepID=UPI000CF3EC4E|nr:hypothetical protein [Tenacibaculum sp. SG-28]PQJ23400.1 hypothetical protein BSU00_04215 [Tenacibaculum sp. SG-28]